MSLTLQELQKAFDVKAFGFSEENKVRGKEAARLLYQFEIDNPNSVFSENYEDKKNPLNRFKWYLDWFRECQEKEELKNWLLAIVHNKQVKKGIISAPIITPQTTLTGLSAQVAASGGWD